MITEDAITAREREELVIEPSTADTMNTAMTRDRLRTLKNNVSVLDGEKI